MTTTIDDEAAQRAAQKEADFREYVRIMGGMLIARRDVIAVEKPNGDWAPERRKFTLDDFRQHIFDKRCLGTYLLDIDNMVKFVAFDVDLKAGATYCPVLDISETQIEGERAEAELDLKMGKADLDAALHDKENPAHRWARMVLRGTIEPLVEFVSDTLSLESLVVVTGGGAHVLVPFGELVAASEARSMARSVMTVMEANGWETKSENFWVPANGAGAKPSLEIEVFPKQDALGHAKGLGNLIRLPLGWHNKAGVRSFFMDARDLSGPSWHLPKMKPMAALARCSGGS